MKKHIGIFGTLILMIFLALFSKELPLISTATADDAAIDYATEEYLLLLQSIKEEEYHEFIEHEWEREVVESFLKRTEWNEEKYKVSQSNGKLMYTTDFNFYEDEDVIIYRNPKNNLVFTGMSFGSQIGYIFVSDGSEFYSIGTSRLFDIFAYGEYMYYIYIGAHGFYGGIRRLAYVDERWVYDYDFSTNSEISNIFYAIDPPYSTLRKAYVFENEAYIITASHIYLFDGVDLTPVFERNIGWGTYSATRIGDSFYIGGGGYIAECNIVTGEEYVWTKIPCSESVCSPKTGDDFSLLFVIVLSVAFIVAMKLTRRSPRYSKNS